jgi:hypothetical protein
VRLPLAIVFNFLKSINQLVCIQIELQHHLSHDVCFSFLHPVQANVTAIDLLAIFRPVLPYHTGYDSHALYLSHFLDPWFQAYQDVRVIIIRSCYEMTIV